MPQKTFYLRNGDSQLWELVSDKARFIHDALRSTDLTAYNKSVVERKKIEKIMEPYVKTIANMTFTPTVTNKPTTTNTKPTEKAPASPSPNLNNYCQGHDNFRRNCGKIGCRYV